MGHYLAKPCQLLGPMYTSTAEHCSTDFLRIMNYGSVSLQVAAKAKFHYRRSITLALPRCCAAYHLINNARWLSSNDLLCVVAFLHIKCCHKRGRQKETAKLLEGFNAVADSNKKRDKNSSTSLRNLRIRF